MMTVERERFSAMVKAALADYMKVLTAADIDAWWGACKGFMLVDVERALREHSRGEDGSRAPRPIDVKRYLGLTSTESGSRCSTSGCQYPGVFSEGTNGGGPWWCPWHREERTGPISESFANASHEVPYEAAVAKRKDRLSRTLDGEPAKIGPPGLVNTAHAIALRHGNKPWFTKDTVRFLDPRPAFNPDAEEAA